MTRERTWPSRRLQLTAMVVLIVGAVLQVLMPSLTPEARARRLYTDSWFVGQGTLFDEYQRDDRDRQAVELLNKALALDPGNSMYEQALVWRYEKKELPELLKSRKLSAEARLLAAAKIHAGGPSYSGYDAKQAETNLLHAEALIKADPTNSLPHYRRAVALKTLGRMDEAYAESMVANRLGPVRLYFPDAPDKVINSLSSPAMSATFPDFSGIRRLAVSFTEVANDRLRHGDVEGACEILDECSMMALNAIASEPHSTLQVIVGVAIQAIAESELKPIYKDFRMSDRMDRLRRLDAAIDRARKVYREEIDYMYWSQRLATAYTAPSMLIMSTTWVVVAIPIASLSLILPAVMRTRRRQDTLALAPWSTGFLVRIFVALYVPMIALSLVAAYWCTDLIYPGDYVPGMDTIGPVPAWASVLVQLLVLGFALRVLHHRYDEHIGERTGIFRFTFRSPANVKVWIRKYLVAALGTQLLFILCLFALATTVYKPISGGHPWETSRFRVSTIAEERVRMKAVADDILNASLAVNGNRNKK